MSTRRPYASLPTDQLRIDTSKAPWMEIARQELGKKIHEMPANDGFVDDLRFALTVNAQRLAVERLELEATPLSASPKREFSLFNRTLKDPTPMAVATLEAPSLARANPEIVKYFDGIKTDPAYDRKGRSWDIAAVHAGGDSHARVTAWCAAFVNWCLKTAGAPYLNYATARSWLDFGTPLPTPAYGCVTVIKPSRSTGSTTGHVAFFCETRGDKVLLLGGNQGDRISEQTYAAKTVLGHRWPTPFDHFLAVGGGSVLT